MRYKVKVPAHVEERVKSSRTTCDSCGKDAEHNNGVYHMDTVNIEARIGDVYPEGDCRTLYEVDLCGPCFVEKVVPALESIGIKVRTRDIEGQNDGRLWDPEATR